MQWFFNNKIITYCLTALGYIPACFIGLSLESYSILFLFMIIDITTGITRDFINKGGVSVKSAILSKGLIKKGHVFIIPWLVVVAGHGMGMDLLLGAKFFLGGFIAAELYSIMGNIFSIYTGEDKPEIDGLKFVLKKSMQFSKEIMTAPFKK